MVWIPDQTTGLLGFLLPNTCSPILLCPSVTVPRPGSPLARPPEGLLCLFGRHTLRSSSFCSSCKANPSPGPPVTFASCADGLSPAREHQTLMKTRAQAALLCLSLSWLLAACKHGSYPAPLPDSSPPRCSVALAGLPGWSLQTSSTALTEATTVRCCPTDRCLLLQDVMTMPGFLSPQRSLLKLLVFYPSHRDGPQGSTFGSCLSHTFFLGGLLNHHVPAPANVTQEVTCPQTATASFPRLAPPPVLINESTNIN